MRRPNREFIRGQVLRKGDLDSKCGTGELTYGVGKPAN